VNWYRTWSARLGLAQRPRVRKLIVAVIGGTVVLLGLALIFLPGPAVVVVPLGLAILATEFAWARRLVRRGGKFWGEMRQYWRGEKQRADSLGNDAR
jgi:Putative transmembrane protein (PGPGW)